MNGVVSGPRIWLMVTARTRDEAEIERDQRRLSQTFGAGRVMAL